VGEEIEETINCQKANGLKRSV